MDILKVSSKSNPNMVAGALAGVIRECGNAEVQAIGAGAVNQAIKAVAIANTFLVENKVKLYCIPKFSEVQIDGEDRTSIRLAIGTFPLDESASE